MTRIVGLDVGGAHLKVAVRQNHEMTEVLQLPCPLWQGLEHLSRALDLATAATAGAERIAVTMTGELSDLFPDRRTGVETLIDHLATRFPGNLAIWMGAKGFATPETAKADPASVGSTNFLATAAAVSRRYPDALLVDFGSTTCDIIPISHGAPNPAGLTDADRQVSSELLYTGFTRTAVMGITTRASLAGRQYGLAREYLATMADVRRILGTLADGLDVHATADGRGKSVAESRVRLARMFGHDSIDHSDEAWRQAAADIADQQLQSLHEAAQAVLKNAALPATAPLIGAGIGIDVVHDLSHRLGRQMIPFSNVVGAKPELSAAISHTAPAVAVAVLLEDT